MTWVIPLPNPAINQPNPYFGPNPVPAPVPVTHAEFDALKREVEALRKLVRQTVVEVGQD